jgi:hypothetical protein
VFFAYAHESRTEDFITVYNSYRITSSIINLYEGCSLLNVYVRPCSKITATIMGVTMQVKLTLGHKMAPHQRAVTEALVSLVSMILIASVSL